MLGTSSRSLQYDPEIERTARANRKAEKLAKEAARLARLEQEEAEASFYNSEEEHIEMAEANPPPPPRRTIGDYGQRNNGEVANQDFQPTNPVTFDIKNTVLTALKENQYSVSESQCPNLHLSHFYEACDYTDPPGRRSEINNFEQGDSETLCDAWERFKLLLKKCPKHGFDGLSQMQMFTQGLRPQT
ncbi:putative athila retroelement ORF1 protein, partial [Trifolium medium]|nr:putative athila retroelement ORF1 protein [Trifolium medium]